MNVYTFILMFLLVIFNLGLGIYNIDQGSYDLAAVSFIVVGYVIGITVCRIIDDL